MIISNKMQDAINEQINAELYSAYLYLSMTAYFHSIGLSGFANWMQKQAEEEYEHAQKFSHYIVERGGRVLLSAIKAPATEWKSPLDVFENSYSHELMVTSLIYKLVDIASAEKDYATVEMLNWFVKEQVEEEDNALTIRDRIKSITDSKGALLYIDKELGKRGRE